MTGKAPGLACSVCTRTYDASANEPWRCSCGAPLELDWRPDGLPATPPALDRDDPPTLDRDEGLWAFADLLAVDRRVSLGEGWTPLVAVPDWNASFKLEYVFPSGSFKDRGATTTLSRAAGLGVEEVVEDSSGNAGAAIAQYAARAGIDARIFVPADAKPGKLAAIERTGATAVRVEGSRQAVTDACVEAVESGAGWYASHAWNPAFFEGTATFAMEVAAQRDWQAPDAVVLPVGHGTLFLGAYRGFRRLVAAGWLDELPRLVGVQATGVAPLVAARGGDDGAAGADEGAAANALADGIQIAAPVRRDQILDAVEATDGELLAVGPSRTEDALARLRRGGFNVEPTSAVAPAALPLLRERGVIADSDDVVVPLTGSGLKDPA